MGVKLSALLNGAVGTSDIVVLVVTVGASASCFLCYKNRRTTRAKAHWLFHTGDGFVDDASPQRTKPLVNTTLSVSDALIQIRVTAAD